MHFAIIGPPKSENTLDLQNYIISRGHQCSVYLIDDLSIDTSSIDHNIFYKHDIYIFRGYNNSTEYAHSIVSLLSNKTTVVIDNILTYTIARTKLQESLLFLQNNIVHPITYYAQSSKQWNCLLTKATFPIIIKPLNGQKGQDILKCNSQETAMQFLNTNPKGFLAQEYIPSDGDIRIFIVNNKIMGAIKRYVVKNDFRSNASLGAKTEKHILSAEESELALRAHKCIGYDISGVDIILNKENKPFVLEVNHTPQWQAFKKTTGINPAITIINYALQKYDEKNRIS